MTEPRTTREALIAEMLGELDALIARVERLPGSIADAETRLTLTAQILDEAGDKYRLAITAFTEEAKLTLTEYLKHKTSQAVSLSIDEHRTALQHAISTALQSETVQDAIRSSGGNRIGAARKTTLNTAQLVEHSVTAVLASMLTVAVLLLFACAHS